MSRRTLLPKLGREQEQGSQAAPGNWRDERNVERNVLPSPKLRHRFGAKASVSTARHGSFPAPWVKVSPLRACADTRPPPLGAVHPLFLAETAQHPGAVPGVPQPSWRSPSLHLLRGHRGSGEREEKQHGENLRGKNLAIRAHGGALGCASPFVCSMSALTTRS